MSRLGLSVVASVLAAAFMALALAGCGSDGSQSAAPSGERLASSMEELARQELEEFGDVMGETQRAAVERVVETGEVSVADYETALSGYRQCMLDLGYREIIFVELANGVKVETTHESGTDQQELKYGDDMSQCTDVHSRSIGYMYEKQVGNPSLLKDPYEAISECLKQEGIADMSYTGEQFKKEDMASRDGGGEAWTFSYPEEDAEAANACKAANGLLVVDNDWPWEYLW